MKKIILLLTVCCFFTQWSVGQTPKWLEKSKRAVFSVITYDKENNILNNGNGFFVTENGVALSDYSSFKGAERAVVIDSDGKQMPVDVILGANSMYDVVKFRVNTGGKKVTSLPLALTPPAVDEEVYLMAYSTQKERLFTPGKVKEVSNIGEEKYYYTLELKMTDKMANCPVMTADGKVFGIAQQASAKDAETLCYAVGISYAMSLEISALSLSDFVLRSIGIKKGLPENEEQALVFLYMASSQVTAGEYETLLADFINEYPNSPDGYVRRAEYYVYQVNNDAAYEKASADLAKALSVTEKKDDVHYNISKIIYNYQLTYPENTFKDWTIDKALEEIRKAIAINSIPIYIQMEGDIYFAKKDFSAAYASYEKVFDTNITSPAVYYSAAKAKELMEADPKEVLALMDSCIAHCPKPISYENAAYLLERAQLYMDTEQYRQAMIDYDSYYNAVSGNVNDVFYYYREQASFHARQFQRALDDIVKAIELNPEEVMYHVELGVINLRVGRYEEAINALNKSLTIAPEYAEAYRLIGICQVQLKQNDAACASFAKAKELGDTAVDALIEKHCK